MTSTTLRPQLAGLPALRLMTRFTNDPIAALERMHAEFGDRAYVRLPGERLIMLVRPDDIGAALVQHADAFHKSATMRRLKMIVGEGLLTTEGDTWRARRRLAAPSLKKKQIAAYGDAMVRHADDLVGAWLASPARSDLQVDMMAVTLKIVVECLLGADLSADVRAVEEAMDDVMDGYSHIVHSALRLLPEWWPSRHRRRLRRGRARLDRILYAVIAARRADPSGDDLLARLIRAQSDEGIALDDVALRDEVATMFLAGHETTALALTYALLLLGQHPDARARLEEEVDALTDRPTMADLGRLPWTGAVVDEALRLYPPAWVIGREVMRPIPDFPAGGLEPGAQIIMVPWLLHRDRRWWTDPLRFDPQRWIDTPRPARFTYLPFGGGPRVCIGNHFARMEAILVLATLLRRARVEVPTDYAARLQPSITLRLRDPLPVRITPR